jgi:aminoglycoside N3'-acetyltransferase|tara:strand:- start:277 stop:1113 length:837 start_codon:yes stop_codon:yes gene_type:complete
MIETTELNLSNHFINDLGIQPDDLVFMFSGIFGLGKLENGLQTIESAIQRALPKGTLIIPTFSYSWSQGEKFNKNTKCPEMGSFSNYVLGLPNYIRTNNPNFSVSIRVNDYNKKLVDYFLDISNDCFGDGSIFDKVVEYSKKNRAWILLLGGAFNDVKYRSTFIHYAQQKVGVPHRYVKSFYSPDDPKIYIKQLVRCLSEEEFLQNSFRKVEGLKFRFPIEENYDLYGKDIENAGLITQKDFGYYPSRMVSVKDSVNLYLEKIKVNPYYCIDKSSISL